MEHEITIKLSCTHVVALQLGKYLSEVTGSTVQASFKCDECSKLNKDF
jgi:hypothetical protein